jgi:hypothetical protein
MQMSEVTQMTRMMIRRRATWLSWLAMLGCTAGGQDSNTAATVNGANQYVVGIDISGSRTASQLQEEQAVVEGLMGRMSFGDRIILVETYRTGVDSAGQWQDSIPARRFTGELRAKERADLEEFRSTAPRVAATFFDAEKSKKIQSTDLFRTVWRAADYARSSNGRRTTLVLLSDMLQSTDEVNMERAGGVPPDNWIEQRKAEGRLPDLANVCVFVVGADPSSKQGAKVRAFWQKYFEAADARMPSVNYRNMVSDVGEIHC